MNNEEYRIRASMDKHDSGVCHIECMPCGATIMAIENADRDGFTDFHLKPTSIETNCGIGNYVTLLAKGNSLGFRAEVSIPCGTFVKWEMQHEEIPF